MIVLFVNIAMRSVELIKYLHANTFRARCSNQFQALAQQLQAAVSTMNGKHQLKVNVTKLQSLADPEGPCPPQTSDNFFVLQNTYLGQIGRLLRL